MITRIRNIISLLDHIAPFKLAEAWDNVGLLVGHPEAEITGILVGLDPAVSLLDEAIAQGSNTIITHHPLIFRPLPAINTAAPIGRFLEKALAHRIQIIACHTNLDSACGGVSDILAHSLGLADVEPLSAGATLPGTGIGRIGNFAGGLDPQLFLERVFSVLDIPSVQRAGLLPDRIFRLALCGGSGSDFAEAAFAMGADVYLSAEIKHSTARWAQDCGFCIIDGTHYATEKPVVRYLATQLQRATEAENLDIPIRETTTEAHPFIFHSHRDTLR
ncbi:MAG: Nif3-like dinuclear metal center hexameric protein [Desulfocapsaceae bacterium]|nr:Nif3-like dinuclear metal center hexameric protein [Desulfocapsaceae bacterium]